MKQQNTETKTAAKVLHLIQKNRKGLLIALCCIVLGIITLTVVYAVNESAAKKAIAEFNSYAEKLSEILGTSASGGTSGAEESDTENSEAAQLIAEIEAFAASKRGFAGSQAYNLVASYYADEKAWDKAEAAWLKSAAKAPKDFLAPSAFFNAAVAAEEQGDNTKAIDYYTQAAEFKGVFGGIVRAYFSMGRIYEAENKVEAALEMYQKIVDDYPEDELAKLAQSRIIVLSN